MHVHCIGFPNRWSQTSQRDLCLAPREAKVSPDLLVIAHFAADSPLFAPADALGCDRQRIKLSAPMSLLLAVNKESMVVDPINWSSLSSKLKETALHWSSGQLTIPDHTDALFRERTHLSYPPRILSLNTWTRNLYRSLTIPYNFYSAYNPCHGKSELLKKLPIEVASQIHKTAAWHAGHTANQLRSLVKVSMEDCEPALTELSRTLFWAGFRIWKKRKLLINRYWQETALENWKKPQKPTPQSKKRKKQKRENKTNCRNPFHFLQKHANYSLQRPTRCPCSNVKAPPKPSQNNDIRTFLLKYPSLLDRPLGRTGHNENSTKHLTSIPKIDPFFTKPQQNKIIDKTDHKTRKRRTQSEVGKAEFCYSREDKIRREHDRGKKRKTVQRRLDELFLQGKQEV